MYRKYKYDPANKSHYIHNFKMMVQCIVNTNTTLLIKMYRKYRYDPAYKSHYIHNFIMMVQCIVNTSTTLLIKAIIYIIL